MDGGRFRHISAAGIVMSFTAFRTQCEIKYGMYVQLSEFYFKQCKPYIVIRLTILSNLIGGGIKSFFTKHY